MKLILYPIHFPSGLRVSKLLKDGVVVLHVRMCIATYPNGCCFPTRETNKSILQLKRVGKSLVCSFSVVLYEYEVYLLT